LCDIVLFTVIPAQAGIPDNLSGTNGSFEFRVSPSVVNNSAYAHGTISATMFNIVSNEELGPESSSGWNEKLQAWTNNGTLHVSGLKPGQTWSVYNINGTLIYHSIATGNEAEIPLPDHNFYIIQSGSRSIKIVQ
jgi:hypothetical protein